MAFIKAFAGALGGSFADLWKDFLTLPAGLPATVGVAKAQRSSNNFARSSNTKASDCVITDGSLILVPEGYSLITLENGLVTGYVEEPGGYIWTSGDVNSKSIFAGGSVRESLLTKTWERFKFGGTPGAAQLAVYVNGKEIPNNRFGTQSPVYWDDAFLNTQVGATARGSYTLKIADPIMFLKDFVPADYYSFNSARTVFDFADMENAAATQLFNEVVASLAASFSAYANSGIGSSRLAQLQSDAVGFAQSLSQTLELNYQWSASRGIQIVKAALLAVDYDEGTKELLTKVQRADALQGARAAANMQASFAQGIEAAGANPDGGAMGMAFMNMAMGGAAMGAMGVPAVAQHQAPAPQPEPAQQPQAEDPYQKLEKLKGLLDKGVITQEDFDAAKRKALGL